MFALQVNKNQIRVVKTEPMTSGSQNVYTVYFSFSEEWANLERVAVFATDVGPDGPIEQTVYNQILDDDNRCFIPWEVNTLHNKHVFVGVFGTMDGNVVLPTVWVDLGNVILGVTTGLEIEPPTPTLWEQILGELNSIKGQLGSGGGSENPSPDTQEIPLSVLEYSNIDDGFQFISGGYLPKVFLFVHVTLKVYEERARGLSSVYFNNEIVYVRREEEESALYVTTMLGVTYKFSYEPDDYRFVNLEIVEYEPESVETFPTIKDTDVNNISAFTNAGIELPCCVHFINSSLWFDFVDDLVYVTKFGDKLIAATMDNALVYFSVDERSGRLSMYKAYNLNERIDLLGEQLDNIQLTPGPKGKDGVTFTPSVSEEGILSWTNDGELQNPQSVNIKGPVGQQGVQGEQGVQGIQGIQGVQGEKGEPFSIAKVYSSVDEMNADYHNNDVSIGQFVVIDTGNVEDEDNAKLFIKGQTSYTFITDLSGAQGIQGPPGTQGEQGIEGPSGQNGVSPTVEVAEIDGGHRVSITDVNGTQTFDVMNGQNISIPSVDSSEVINAPIGSIMAWSGDADSIPQGWHVCDGEDGTVDLRDKFILAAGGNYAVGDEGGSEEVTLTVEQMPSHLHSFDMMFGTGTSIYDGTSIPALLSRRLGYVINGDKSGTAITSSVGSSEPHPNMPPYIALIFIQKISASPSDYVTEERVDEKIEEALANQNGSENGVPSGFIGMWSGAVVPNGWALCDGTNGTPDLRGRFVLGSSESHAMGENGGSEEVTLTIEQMPRHYHSIPYSLVISQAGSNRTSSLVGSTNANVESSSYSGSSQPHSNMPPYYVLAYIMKL